MQRNNISLQSPMHEKIAWAETCHHYMGDQLLRDEKIAELLRELRESINGSHRKMAEAGVVEVCRDCEEREGGSCCGAGLENKYDGFLLLINLLLGIKLPKQGYDPSSCFFLGKEGCLLLARHVICVNYLCKKITDHIDPKSIAVLREKEGAELELLFLLSERIKQTMRAHA